MKLNEYKREDYIKIDVHKIIGENSLISSYWQGKGHFYYKSESEEVFKTYLNKGHNNNLIFVL